MGKIKIIVPTRPVIENSIKTAKKFKKLKNNFTASFEAKIGRKRQRKRENKNYRSVTFLLDGLEKFQKVAENIKIKNKPL